jgi:hypothetical protein
MTGIAGYTPVMNKRTRKSFGNQPWLQAITQRKSYLVALFFASTALACLIALVGSAIAGQFTVSRSFGVITVIAASFGAGVIFVERKYGTADVLAFTKRVRKLTGVPRYYTKSWVEAFGDERLLDRFLRRIISDKFRVHSFALGVDPMVAGACRKARKRVGSVSEPNRPYAVLLSLSGIEADVIVAWEDLDMAQVLVIVSEGVPESMIRMVVENGLDSSLVQSMIADTASF